MQSNYLGIDISKDKFDVCLLKEGGRRTRQRVNGVQAVFNNTPEGFTLFFKWLEGMDVKDLHACMEATSRYGDALACFLYELGFKVSVVNPYQVKHFAKSEGIRGKTDRIDARVIAQFCQSNNPISWKPLRAENRKLSDLTRRRLELEKMLVQEKNRLKTPSGDKDVRKSIDALIEALEAQIKAIDEKMKEVISSDDELKMCKELVDSIPGIGEKSAMMLMGIVGDFARFEDSRKFAAWAGLVPCENQSGKKKGKPYLTKQGVNIVKKLLFLPTMAAIRSNEPIRLFASRLKTRGKSKMQIIMAAMHKLLSQAFGVVKSQKPYSDSYCH
jgi:transposase